MSRIVIATILVAVLLAGCTGPSIGNVGLTGSGHVVSTSFDLSGFTQLEANSGAQVEMTHGDAFAVTVDTDDNLVSHLDVGVTGSTLHIRFQNGSYNNSTLRAKVTMPQLKGVTLDGGSTLHGEVRGEDLAVHLNGGARATLTGTAGRVTIDVNGGAEALLSGVTAQDVQVSANGGARIEIGATGAVTGSANGGATVVISGSPTSVNVHTDGGAQVITR